MDAIKKGLDKVSGGDKSKGSDSKGSSDRKDDWLDKGVSAGVDKSGYDVSKENQNKATDFARDQYKNQTGNDIPGTK